VLNFDEAKKDMNIDVIANHNRRNNAQLALQGDLEKAKENN
jgi:hypothetical protein